MAERRALLTARTPSADPPESSPPRGRADLEAGLRIDRDDLDGELVQDPDLYYRVALDVAHAVARHDAAKLELDTIEANLDVTIRADGAAAGEKTTEAGIKQAMRLDPRYHTVRQSVLDAASALGRASALKEAYGRRASALRDLVSLALGERSRSAGAAGAYEDRARRAEEARDMRPSRRPVRSQPPGAF